MCDSHTNQKQIDEGQSLSSSKGDWPNDGHSNLLLGKRHVRTTNMGT